MSSVTLATAIRDLLAERMRTDDRVVVLGESVGRAGGIAGTTEGLLDEFGPQRVIDLPVADRAIVAVAVGLAMGGARPVVELTSTSRLPAVLEVLAEAASVATDGEFPLPLVVRVPCGTEAGARVDRAATDLLGSVPGLSVVSPSSPDIGAALLATALGSDGPVVVLEPRALYDERAKASDAAAPLGQARRLRDGDLVTLVTWGDGLDAALEAAARLDAEGISAAVVDLLSLQPLDASSLGTWVRSTGRVVVVSPEPDADAARVLHALLGEAFLYYESPPVCVAARPETVVAAARAAVHY